MSYNIHVANQKFRIRREHQEAAFVALRELAQQGHLYWGVDEDILTAFSLPEALAKSGWEPTLDDTRDIIEIQYTFEKGGSEDEIFAALAPYVEAGSWIELYGADNETWRYVFDGRSCDYIHPIIIWPNELEEKLRLLAS
jgi:hypothetical protein